MDWRAAKESIYGISARVFDDGDWVHHPVGGAAVAIPAVFREQYEGVDPDTGVPVTELRPHLAVRLSDLPSKPKFGNGQAGDEADEFERDGERWRAYDVQEDSGWARIFLHKIAAS